MEFIVYQGAAWKRIFQLRLTIEADGGVRRDPGELLANLG